MANGYNAGSASKPSSSGAKGANKPPEPMCAHCGSPLAKSPLGQAALRQVEGVSRLHQQMAGQGLRQSMPKRSSSQQQARRY